MSYDSTYDSTWSSPNSSNETSNSLEAVDSSPWPKVLIPAQAMPSSFSLGHSKTILSDSDTSSRSSSQRETAAELFGFKPNYYPHFDPKEYFCDTVAVENASMVAQIVGKKGAKIKHLVAKFGTRIRTPNVDQEPVFVIKGKRADVYKVKQEIMSAAAHFMRIELTKREKLDSVMNSEGKYSSWSCLLSLFSNVLLSLPFSFRIDLYQALRSHSLRWPRHRPQRPHRPGTANRSSGVH